MSTPQVAAALLVLAITAPACEAPGIIGALIDEPDAGGDGDAGVGDAATGEPRCDASGFPDAFTVIDYFDHHYGPLGCTKDPVSPALQMWAEVKQTKLVFHLQRADTAPFPENSAMKIFVGHGPNCESPPNKWKGDIKYVVSGEEEQTMELLVDPYEPYWFQGETKHFWIGVENGLTFGVSATGTVLVERRCFP